VYYAGFDLSLLNTIQIPLTTVEWHILDLAGLSTKSLFTDFSSLLIAYDILVAEKAIL
jgi:hypothetical protein